MYDISNKNREILSSDMDDGTPSQGGKTENSGLQGVLSVS